MSVCVCVCVYECVLETGPGRLYEYGWSEPSVFTSPDLDLVAGLMFSILASSVQK